ncbi:hypothetical protein EG835_06445 [bacterium]|nr:hypothetical protein [bacterium]
MRTPAGRECIYYYEDFGRGASRQECRILKHPRSQPWEPSDCSRCRLPQILAANANPHLEVRIHIERGILGLGRRVSVEAWCGLHGPVIDDPLTGCPECNAEADRLLRQAFK